MSKRAAKEKILLQKDGMNRIIKELVSKLNSKLNSEYKKVLFLCINSDSCYIGTKISESLTFKHNFEIINFNNLCSIKSEEEDEVDEDFYDNKTIEKKYQIFLNNKNLIENSVVLLFSIIYDEITFHILKKYVKNFSCDKIINCCVLYKHQKKYKYKLPKYIGLIIPDLNIYGFGIPDDFLQNKNIKKLVISHDEKGEFKEIYDSKKLKTSLTINIKKDIVKSIYILHIYTDAEELEFFYFGNEN